MFGSRGKDWLRHNPNLVVHSIHVRFTLFSPEEEDGGEDGAYHMDMSASFRNCVHLLVTDTQ